MKKILLLLSLVGISNFVSPGCLVSAPNPSWYYFQNGFAGTLIFNMHQGNNPVLYNNTDIDYIFWNSFIENQIASKACNSLANLNVPLNPNKIVAPVLGSTKSSIVCGVDLGPTATSVYPPPATNTISFCDSPISSQTLHCNFQNPPANQNTLAYQWFLNGVLQPTLTTKSVTVTQSGTWKVKVTHPDCGTPTEDSVIIYFGSTPVVNPVPTQLGPLGDCYPVFNITSLIPALLAPLNPADFTVSFFTDYGASLIYTDPVTDHILNPSAFQTNVDTTIWVRARNNTSTQCVDSEEISFLLDVRCTNNATAVGSTICTNDIGQLTFTGPPNAVVTFTQGTNTYNITLSAAGSFTWNTPTPLTATTIYTLTNVVAGSPVVNTPLIGNTATITVNPSNTVSLPSATPTICIYNVLIPITHITTGATGIGAATGLPAGVTATWAANTITISGTPVVAGAFNYSIPLTGGCGTVNATGTIIISGNSPSSISADGTTTTSVSVNNGNTVQLQLNGFFGSPSNIQWTPNIGISSTTISNPIVYPSTTTIYTASFINSNGCLQTTSITVNVNPLPNIGNISISTTNNSVVGLFDTITVNVQLTNATDLYSLYMKLKGNAAVSQYLDYSGYVASTLLGPLPDVIATNPIVTNGEYDFGITKIGAVPGYTGSGLFYTFKFVTKNIPIPDGTVFCFYLDDLNTYNSIGTACGLTNQGQYCFTFTNQIKVWPGDLNNSNVVTTADLLPIGYFYNSTGPVRPNATIQWTGQPATLWGYNHSFLNSNAYKTFADSNGDGVINNADQAAIGFNMNQVHARQASDKPFGIAPNTSNNAQVVGALNVTPNVSIINGAVLPQTVTFTVNLTNTGGLSSLYGISTNLIFDNTIFDLSTATIDYTGSIFGLVNTDCLAINYNSATGVSVGLTRYANTAINGQGLLFKVTLQTKTTLPNLPQTQVTSYVDAANNQLGNPLEIGDSTPMNFSVINVNLGVQDTVLNTFKLYPNPTKGILYFSVGDSYLNFQELKLKIVNTLGQVIDQISVKSATEEIITKNWGGAGMYFVQIETTQGEILGVKKIILQ